MNRVNVLPTILALVLATPVRSDELKESRPVAVPGPPKRVVKVEEGSLTVELFATDKAGPRQLTVDTDPKQTKVKVGVVVDEQGTPDGKVRTSVKFRPGSLKHVEAGQRVHLTVRDGLATEILVIPMPPRKVPDKAKKEWEQADRK